MTGLQSHSEREELQVESTQTPLYKVVGSGWLSNREMGKKCRSNLCGSLYTWLPWQVNCQVCHLTVLLLAKMLHFDHSWITSPMTLTYEVDLSSGLLLEPWDGNTTPLN